MKRILLLALIITIAATATVKAQEWAEREMAEKMRISNLCFDNTGKWYTR